MATYTWTFEWDGGSGDYDVTGPGQTAGTRLDIIEGDVLTFNVVGLGTYAVTPFSASYFTASGDLSLVGNGATGSKTVKSPPTAASFNLTVTRNGTLAKTIYLQTVVPSNAVDQFSLGADIGSALTSSTYHLAGFTVTGLLNGTFKTMTCTNGTFRYYRGGAWSAYSTSHSITRLDWINTKVVTGASTGVALTCTLAVTGGVSDSAVVTTGTNIEIAVPFHITTGAISLLDVANFFAGPKTNIAINSYYRGGTYVPDIIQNQTAGHPASGQIALDDFYTSWTRLYYVNAPQPGYDTVSSILGTLVTASATWAKALDFEVGYGPDMEDNIDYRFTHNEGSWVIESGFGTPTFKFNGVTIAKGAAAYSTGWITGFSFITASLEYTGYMQAVYTGSIQMEIRHKYNPSYILSTDVSYFLEIIDPID